MNDNKLLTKAFTPKATKVSNVVSVIDLRSVICNILNLSDDCSDKELLNASVKFKEKFYGKDTRDEGIGIDEQPDPAIK